jgi:hypothetical protein
MSVGKFCLSSLLVLFDSIGSVNSHTYKICAGVKDQTVTFYAGHWDAHSYSTSTVGGVILSNGPSGNGRYDFTGTIQVDANEYPLNTDLDGFECTVCGTTRSITYFSEVTISDLECGGMYDVTTTTDSATEWPACTFPSITIPECGCDETIDSMCTISGDPHFTTWDNSRHHFQGVGYYDLIDDCAGSDINLPFTVTGWLQECDRWAPMTCVFEVRVTLSNGDVIVYSTDGSADPTFLSSGNSAAGTDVDFGDGYYTASPGSFSVMYDVDGTIATTSFTYSNWRFVAKTSSGCHQDRMCGLCGSVDGDSTNDFEERDGDILDNTGAGTWRVPDDIWQNTHTFGETWCNEDFTNDPDCVPTTAPTQPPQECFDAVLDLCQDAFDEFCTDCNDDINEADWLNNCQFDACVACPGDDGNLLTRITYEEARNADCFGLGLIDCDTACDGINLGGGGFPVDCFYCPDQCNPLTSTQQGCSGDECLLNCQNCETGIDWNDYAGGQSTECACHENGCDQCDDGWFKLDYDFPCQTCSSLIGCSHCTDFLGCQECEEGYTLTEDTTGCGDGAHNTGNANLHYCIPDSGTCIIGAFPTEDIVYVPTCPTVTTCTTNPCLETESNCFDYESWGCSSCYDTSDPNASGSSFHMGYQTQCMDCSVIEHCQTCGNWNGCTSCEDGYYVQWDNDCGMNLCFES